MDSDRSRTGELHGVTFHNIDEIGQISFDVIVVAPAYHKMEIIHQLMAHGITKDKIIPWLPFVCSATPETTIRIEDDSCLVSSGRVRFRLRHSSDFGVLNQVYAHAD